MLRARLVLIALAAIGSAVLARPIHAQSAEQDAVRAVVTGLFDAMRTRDTAAMRAAFDSTAALHSVGADRVRPDAISSWISSVATAPAGVVLDERLGTQMVQLDGTLATVWVRYHFYVGDRFSHCGVDAFTLAKSDGRWRILSVADTRQREGCEPLT
jgi:hypothetical protein